MILTSKIPVDQRLGLVYQYALDSDYYSRDGLTWDETADAPEYSNTSYDFRLSIGDSIRAIDPFGYSLKGLPVETLKWIDRVESRMNSSQEQTPNA
jgi:hypothetical protein